MSDLGDRALGSTVTLQFTTAVNGVPTALAGSPAISVYGSNSSTPITAGVTLTGSYNSTTGLNNVAIVASAGNGFAAGIDYSVVITTGTLGGVSMVGYQVGAFSLNLGNVANLDDQAITAAAGVTFPSSVASPTNITAGTITTVSGNVTGSVGSVVSRVSINSNQLKDTIQNGFMFVMTDSTTHLPKTGLTVTSQVALDGGAFAATTNSPTELSNGVYILNLAAADVNGNHVMLLFTATGADTLFVEEVTQP
jgi:hypothetical protein